MWHIFEYFQALSRSAGSIPQLHKNLSVMKLDNSTAELSNGPPGKSHSHQAIAMQKDPAPKVSNTRSASLTGQLQVSAELCVEFSKKSLVVRKTL